MNSTFIANAWRDICLFVDSILYWLVSLLYQLFYYVANATFLDNNGIIQEIYNRVFLVLGVFMMFVLAFELIQILINPDTMNDKERGLGKIITRIVVAVVLLGMVNPIFSEAFELQRIIINNDLPGKLISGVSNKLNPSDAATGLEFSKSLFFSFVRDDEDPYLQSAYGDNATIETIKTQINTEDGANFNIVHNYINQKDQNETKYVIEYSYIISGATALFVIWILINYTISCAVRVVQLAFLRLIAPIPIIGNITKKGEDRFKKWIKQCVTTYLDLFIRLIIIALAMFLIQAINQDNSIGGINGATAPVQAFIKVIIILGILMFAKKAPDLIKELFPSSGAASGDFGLSLKNRFKDNLAGKAFGIIGGTAATGAKKLISGFDSAAHGKGFWAGARKVEGKGFFSKALKNYRSLIPYAEEERKKELEARGKRRQLRHDYNAGKTIAGKESTDRRYIGKDANGDYVFGSGYNKEWVSAVKNEAKYNKDLTAADAALRAAEKSGQGIEEALNDFNSAKGKYDTAKKELEIANELYSSDAAALSNYKLYNKDITRKPFAAAVSGNSSNTPQGQGSNGGTGNGSSSRGPGFTGSTGNGTSSDDRHILYGNNDDGAE